jgi:glutamate---cysteine ligase / carboxylate-amine ligase
LGTLQRGRTCFSRRTAIFTIGVEEEFHLIDPDTREIAPDADRVLSEYSGDEVEAELQASQVEIGTAVCETMADVRKDLIRLRREAAAAAEKVGKRIAASGTHPFSDWRETKVFKRDAYIRLEEDYQQLTREQVLCGCHVHVGIDDPDDAIEVMNRVRPWLPVVLAVSVNSPLWLGEVTGYCSYRNRLWQRWPTAGIPGSFSSRADYEALRKALLATRSIDDPARIYWDVRPSNKFNTIEFRVADACSDVDDSLLVAALVRAISETCYREMKAGSTGTQVRDELIKSAIWRAARYGTSDRLIDPKQQRLVPAYELVSSMLEVLRPVLEDRDEWSEVQGLVTRLRSRGTGAERQLAQYEKTGSLEDVVDLIVAETSPD